MPDDRAALAAAFLAGAGWGAAARAPLAGDASARRYERLKQRNATAVLMDTPPEQGETAVFSRMSRWLLAHGLSAPRVLAEDAARGFMLLEDLGDALFARLIAADAAHELPLYSAACDLLTELHRHPPPDWLAPYDPERLGEMVAITAEWYLPAFGIPPEAAADLPRRVTEAAERLLTGPRVICLRDYHAENLIWLERRQGVARVGLLDFQDAFSGHPAYDLVSLLQDARRDVPDSLETRMISRFVAANGMEPEGFDAAYALSGAQRNLRILGVFARLALRDGKPQYLAMLPRVWHYLRRDLAHPALSDLARAAAAIPEPVPETLREIAERCRQPSP